MSATQQTQDIESADDLIAYTDRASVLRTLKASLEVNAETIRKRRQQDCWDGNPAVDHVIAKDSRAICKTIFNIRSMK